MKILQTRWLIGALVVFALLIVLGQLTSYLSSLAVILPANVYSERLVAFPSDIRHENNIIGINSGVSCAIGYYIDNSQVLKNENLVGWPIVQSTGVLGNDIVPECVGDVKISSNLATALNLGLLALALVISGLAINTQRKVKK